MSTATTADLEAIFRASLRPPPNVLWYEWARDGGIILPAKVATPRKGPYDVWFTPALVRAAAALADPAVWCVVIKKGSQGGATQMGFAWLGSMAVLDPEQSAVVLGTLDLARQRSRNTFRPMIQASPELFAEVESHKDALSIAEYEFKRSRLFFFGGGSPTGLSSNAFVRIHISEENKFEEDKKEGSPVELTLERMKNFIQRKALRECTPSVPGMGISKAFEDGTRERMHVPCPHCGERSTLGFHEADGGHFVVFDSSLSPGEAATGARYVCRACRTPWTDSQRWDALDAAARMDNHGYIGDRTITETGGIVSIHYPSALSPMVKVEDIVRKFLRTKESPSELKTFVTGWLGQDWQPEVRQVHDSDLVSCRAAYDVPENGSATNPFDAPEIKAKYEDVDSLVTVAVDVQKAGFWVLVRRWWKGGASALLSFRFVERYAQVREIEEHWMARMMEEHKARMEAKQAKIQKRIVVWIDSGDGNKQPEILEAALKYGWIATKGSSAALDSMFRETVIELQTGWRIGQQATSVAQVLLNTGAAKMDLLDRIQKMERHAEGKMAEGETVTPWWIPGNMPSGKANYCGQVTAERFNAETGLWELRPGYKHNHALDVECMAWIAAYACGMNSMVLD